MKKLKWVILGLSVVLCVALVFNWNKIASALRFEKTQGVIGNETYVSEENYFESAKYSRDQVRAETVTALEKVLNDEKTDEQTRLAAEEDISAYSKASESETKIENLVIAKGFSNCVAFIGDGTVSVVVEEKLSPEDAAKIIDIAVSETKYPSSQVKIIELSEDNPEKN